MYIDENRAVKILKENYVDVSDTTMVLKKDRESIKIVLKSLENKDQIIDCLEKRIKHLLQSNVIRKYDEKNIKTGEYILDIDSFDEELEKYRNNYRVCDLMKKIKDLENECLELKQQLQDILYKEDN